MNVCLNLSRWANHASNHDPKQRTKGYTKEEKRVFDMYHVEDMDDPPRYFTKDFHPFHTKGRDTCRVWRFKPESVAVRNRMRFYMPDEFISDMDYREWAGR